MLALITTVIPPLAGSLAYSNSNYYKYPSLVINPLLAFHPPVTLLAVTTSKHSFTFRDDFNGRPLDSSDPASVP